MKIAKTVAFSLALTLFSCASKSTAPDQDVGLQGEGAGTVNSAPDTNPDGVPYPTDNIGTAERKGSKPGNHIANFKFLGYPGADTSQGLQPISLAQFYDPSGSRFRVIHVQASGVWCTACQAETEVVVPMKAELEAKKAVWLVSLAEGPTPGTPSTQKDLDRWIAEFKSPYTHWLDPGNKNLGPFYDRTALPWNANIDARTMEILTAGTGAVTSKAGIHDEIDEAIRMSDESSLK